MSETPGPRSGSDRAGTTEFLQRAASLLEASLAAANRRIVSNRREIAMLSEEAAQLRGALAARAAEAAVDGEAKLCLQAAIRALARRLAGGGDRDEPNPPQDLAMEPPDAGAPRLAGSPLPDGLKQYIGERFGDEAVAFVREIVAIVDRHEADPAGFVGSPDCRLLLGRLRRAAADPEPGRPVEVSIVLPVDSGLVFALTSVLAILTWRTRHPFEVVVGEDAPSDRGGDILAQIGGRVRYWRHEERLGLLLNCNLTAWAARGHYLVFLAPGILPLPGWLDELIGTLAADREIGCVGVKLLGRDGRLRQAGGIVWGDGARSDYGSGEDPRLPEFNYVKEADFCSGAALALPKAVWDGLGGFDPRYAPAGGEDVDLAFRLRQAGYKALYQPFAEAIRLQDEIPTGGDAVATGVKAIARRRIGERWADHLGDQYSLDGGRLFVARDRSRNRPHILFVDLRVPQWDRDCGSRLIYLYMKLFLDSGFRVTFWPDDLLQDQPYTRELQQLGIEMIYSPAYRDRFAAWTEQNGEFLDYVFLSRPHVAVKYLNGLRERVAGPILYYGHELIWCRLMLEHSTTQDDGMLAEIDACRELEDRVCDYSDAIFYPSPEECDIVRLRFPAKTVIELPIVYFDRAAIEAARELAGAVAGRDPFHLVFVAGFAHVPNVDAALWLVGEVFERLRARDPRFRLTIAGSQPPQQIRDLASEHIAITGPISDQMLAELYRGAGVFVAPLRFGGGVKCKVIDSFAYGAPLVSTTSGMQGIDEAEDVAFVADDAEDFTAAVVCAATDRELAKRKAGNAAAFLARKYSRERVQRLLSTVVPELAMLPPIGEPAAGT